MADGLISRVFIFEGDAYPILLEWRLSQSIAGALMIIRDEQPTDLDAIRAITSAAFAQVPQSRQTEVAVIDSLRAAGDLAVSLVAVEEGEVIGHIAFSPVSIDHDDDPRWYGGGPLAVRPDRQRRGVGSSLVRAGLQRLAELGAHGCVLVGDPAYYQRFGFRSYPGLTMPNVPAQNLLALALGTVDVKAGNVKFAPAFDVGAS
ncbi:GNAT family N-acetyltransferase [Mycolicibacterium stellerae]|uniref:GNAT family N-acetyltransferase n=1 Tax=Mycolicibacterium stellerae TaxID=2358193 RepID=UPI001F3A3525|nr:N-acetyltransferase [Mycolicibacterium stellerae]